MNSKITLGLLAAALGAVGYLVWLDRDRPGTEAAVVADRKVVPAAGNRQRLMPIDRMEIVGPNGKIELAMDRARAWHLLSPAPDAANPAVVREPAVALG